MKNLVFISRISDMILKNTVRLYEIRHGDDVDATNENKTMNSMFVVSIVDVLRSNAIVYEYIDTLF